MYRHYIIKFEFELSIFVRLIYCINKFILYVLTFIRMQITIDPFEEQSGAQYTIKRLMDDIGNILKRITRIICIFF